ncbi:MAG: flagellar hook-basal body complex protein [Lachnospiraceae bacterium]|nr:flagellar hook-basal body complex protein [Lachnospiraceae bacterium]
MMRSLYSGVSGLKTHQTRMDVIGNNIANVNTTAYKSKSINFSDMLYQTTQSATGATTSTGGTNARQIGLGVKTAAINTSITTEGSSQSTGNPFDLKLTGECFFVVSDGSSTYYTRDGSFDVDDAGNLVMSSTGYIVQGWSVDSDGNIIEGSVSNLNLYSKSTYDPAATTAATVSGILDNNDSDLETTTGQVFNLQIYDALGYEYNLQFGILPQTSVSNTTYDVINTENEYTLKSTLYQVDTSELTYTYYDDEDEETKTLTTTDSPTLIDYIETAVWAYISSGSDSTGAISGTHTIGTSDSVTVDVDTLVSYYGLDILDNSDLAGQTITVTFSGDTGYTTSAPTYPLDSNTAVSTISDDAVALFYTEGTTADGYTTYTLNADYATVTTLKQTYEDDDGDTVTEYTFKDDSGNTITVDSSLWSDVLKVLALGEESDTQDVYTTQETKEVTSTVDGSFTLSLLGMTTTDGDEVDISSIDTTSWELVYSTDNGSFTYVGSTGNDTFTLSLTSVDTKFSNLTIDMSDTTNVDNDGSSTITAVKDDGRKVGTLSGVSIGTDGLITATYSNGMTSMLGQICVATFANSMGLSSNGDNLYIATSASGDCSIVDISASGTGYMTTGVLEMSNVDLSTEFTNLITTQRGFQANSRIITVSDTLLEELVNLKR